MLALSINVCEANDMIVTKTDLVGFLFSAQRHHLASWMSLNGQVCRFSPTISINFSMQSLELFGEVVCLFGIGLVWFGLVWFGLVWFGLVWCLVGLNMADNVMAAHVQVQVSVEHTVMPQTDFITMDIALRIRKLTDIQRCLLIRLYTENKYLTVDMAKQLLTFFL